MKLTQDPRSTPYEIRVGIGMPGFRGMRTVGDPSFIPPTKFRFLQNVRLGAGDVKSRPGLTAFDTLGAAAVWLTEIDEQVQSSTLYMGPSPTLAQMPYNGAFNEKMMHGYIRIDFSVVPVGTGDTDNIIPASALFNLFPKWDQNLVDDGDQAALAPCGLAPYLFSEGVGPLPAGPPGNITAWEDNQWQSGVHALGFFQVPNCVDPVVRFTDREGNDRWFAAGHYRGDRWTGVGDYEVAYYSMAAGAGFVAAVGDPTVGGQALVEINFDTRSPLDRVVLGGYAPGLFDTTPLFAGGVTEVIRLPPPGYKRGCTVWGPAPVPTASFNAAMYPNSEWIRSMVNVGRRKDSELEGTIAVEDTIYIGTTGGKVLAIDGNAGGGLPDATLKWGINDPSDGDVWEFDGTTLTKVLSGVGQMVLLGVLPDGGVLAAGRDNAAFLPEPGASWAAVTYAPSWTVPPDPIVNGGVYSWNFNYGFFWYSRAVFQGELYLIGFDIGAGFDTTAYGQPTVNPALYMPDRLVIYKFDPSTLTLNLVRRGTMFDQLVAVPGRFLSTAMVYQKVDKQTTDLVLATDGIKLYYLHQWATPLPPDSNITYVGTFDGVTWDDDAYGWSVGPTAPVDMVASGQAIWLVHPPGVFYRILNNVLTLMANWGSGGPSHLERPFVGP